MAMSIAEKSGMRGMERKTPEAGPAPSENEPGAIPDGGAELSTIIGQHTHGPDEQGHHHLNLTTLAHHIVHGKHPGAK